MNVPQIRMSQTFARIGLDRTPPQQEIRQPQAQLNMRQEPAKLIIDRTPASLEIDTTEARAAIDMKSVFRRSDDFSNWGYQDLLEGIARRAQEGDRLRSIESGENAITGIAYDNSHPPRREFPVTTLYGPDSVRIRFDPAQLDIRWERGGVQYDPVTPAVEHRYTPGKVEVYLAQKNSLTIDFIGLFTDELV